MEPQIIKVEEIEEHDGITNIRFNQFLWALGISIGLIVLALVFHW
jgi:hypothetical protein